MSSKASKKTPVLIYSEGESVQCADKGVYYPAKIVKVENCEGQLKYFVHFDGWSRKYDTWTEANMLAKKDAYTGNKDTDSQKHKGAINVADENDTAASLEAAESDDTTMKTNYVTEQSKPPQKKRERCIEHDSSRDLLNQDRFVDIDEDKYFNKFPLSINLKRHMVDEWTLITQGVSGKGPDAALEKRLVSLPKKKDLTLDAIARDFLESKGKRLDVDQLGRYKSILDGLILYYEKALPIILLYRQERDQFDRLRKKIPNLPLSQVYGAEHLLRLYVRLPSLMQPVVLSEQETSWIHDILSELLKFLDKYSSLYFDLSQYRLAEEVMNMDVHASPAPIESFSSAVYTIPISVVDGMNESEWKGRRKIAKKKIGE